MKGRVLIIVAFLMSSAMTAYAAPINVAIYQSSYHGTADAAGHVANQLNNDTYFDFTATVITNAALLDSVAALSAYNAVVIGDDGFGLSRSGWNTMGAALKAWVGAGGALVTSAWTTYWGDLNQDIKDILPVAGAFQYVSDSTLVITDAGHAVTTGVNSFVAPAYQNLGDREAGCDGSRLLGEPRESRHRRLGLRAGHRRVSRAAVHGLEERVWRGAQQPGDR